MARKQKKKPAVSSRNTAPESEARQRYKHIVDSSPDAIATYDLTGRLVSVNPAGLKMAGKKSLKEAVGKHFTKLGHIHVKRIPAYLKVFTAVLRGKKPDPLVDSYTRKDGSTFVGETRITPLKKNGKIYGVQSITRDITDRIQTEQDLRESRQRFRDIALSSADWIWEIDSTGKYTFASGRIKQLLGYAPEELIGKSPFSLMPPAESRRLKKEFTALLKKKKPIVDLININRAKDGTERIFLTNGVPVFDSQGEFQGYRGVDKDITHAEHMKAALERSEERYRIVTELVSDFAYAYEVSGHSITIDWVTQALESISGYTQKELHKRGGWTAMVYKEDMRIPEQQLSDLLQGKDSVVEYRIQHKDGQIRWVRDYARAVKAPGTDTVVKIIGAVKDITQEKEVDQAKTEFVSVASHQLRTPLSAINWYLELLRDTGLDSIITKKQEKYLHEIDISTRRMEQLVDALLNVSRIDMGTLAIEPEPTDILKLCDDVLLDFALQINAKKMNVEKKYGRAIPALSVDPNLMRILLQNLLSNAIKYTPDKGTIRIEIRKRPGAISISVADTGYGIPKAQQDQVFKKLFRADNIKIKAVEGTGLGLYIVKSIVELSGGTLSFDSAVNKGSTFRIELPLKGMPAKKGTRDLQYTES